MQHSYEDLVEARKRIKAQLRDDLLEQYGKTCPGCNRQYDGVRTRLSIDHKLPTSRGGTDSRDNLWLLCRNCNNEKSWMTVEEWQQWRASGKPKLPPIPT